MAYQRYQDALGPAHAQTIMLRAIVGSMTPDRKQARALHDKCAALDDQLRGECVYEAAWIADEDGDIAEATRLMASHPQQDSPSGRIAQAYVKMRRDGLTAQLRHELEAMARTPGKVFYEHLYAGDAWMVLALGSTGTAADAAWESANERAVAARISVYRRRVVRSDAELAQRWRTSRPKHAVAHAMRALAWYRASASDQALVRLLEAITATGPDSR